MNSKTSILDKTLKWIEKVGNALPHPATLFAIFALLIIIFSAIASYANWTAHNPVTNQIVVPRSLLTKEGIHWILLSMVNNFTSFAPLGIVLVAMLGIGIAEHSGLISAFIKWGVSITPPKLLTFTIVFLGILSNVASDVGYVLLVPLAGVIYQSLGRNPLVGMAAAFAGVSGGFSANLFLGTVDPLLAGLSTEAAHIQNPEYEVNPTANYYFMAASTFLISIIITWITEKFVAPRLEKVKINENTNLEVEKITVQEKKALKYSFLIGLVLSIFLAVLLIPENGFFRGHKFLLKEKSIKKLEISHPNIDKKILWDLNKKIADKKFYSEDDFKNALKNILNEAQMTELYPILKQKALASEDGLLTTPLLKGVVALLFIFASVMGITFGIIVGKYKNDKDVIKGMTEAMKSLGLYLVLVFFAAQFVAYFKYSNLGEIIAIKGADFIKNLNVSIYGLIILFVLLSAFLNLFMGSASAKWAILAPVFVPMFMFLGYSPEFAQVIYRIGDSSTNIISPMMSFFALIIAFFQKYDKNAGLGTLISTMLPYSVALIVIWTAFLMLWVSLGLDLGPGAGIYYSIK